MSNMDDAMQGIEHDFVIVSKDGTIEDDADSVASDKSSVCLVEDPSADPGLFEASDDEENTEKDGLDSGTAPKQGLDSDASETENLIATPVIQKEEIPSPKAVLPTQEQKYICTNCRVDIAAASDIVWEGYMGANVPAFLLKNAKNTELVSTSRQQQLSTGVFLVQDVQCRNCSARLGWTYLKTHTPGQEYKVGKTIVSRSAVNKYT